MKTFQFISIATKRPLETLFFVPANGITFEKYIFQAIEKRKKREKKEKKEKLKTCNSFPDRGTKRIIAYEYTERKGRRRKEGV